ncbi:hypothetical protein ACHAWX_000266 [Stephanocyclus meneghinianus]
MVEIITKTTIYYQSGTKDTLMVRLN